LIAGALSDFFAFHNTHTTADDRARALVASAFDDADTYADLDRVRWCCTTDKRACYPVFVEHQRRASLASRSDVGGGGGGGGGGIKVRFLGHLWKESWKQGEYPKSFLKPFDHDPAAKKRSAKALKSSDEAAAGSSPASDPEWNRGMLNQYLALLSKQDAFRGPHRLYHLRVEESYLKFALLQIRENRIQKERQQEQRAAARLLPCAGSDDDDDEDDDARDGSPSLSSGDPPLSQTSAATCASDAAAAAFGGCGGGGGGTFDIRARPRFVLRAGDQIRYVPPIDTADAKNIRTAFVAEVYDKKEDMVLLLSDGMYLSKEESVSVVGRWCRNKFVPSKDTTYYYLQHFRLDRSHNGRVDLRTQSDAMHEFVNDAAREVERTICEHARGEAAADNAAPPAETTTIHNSSSSRKRPRDDEEGGIATTANREGSTSAVPESCTNTNATRRSSRRVRRN
jgi:hypothetical protein